jgi:hypothetical protein
LKNVFKNGFSLLRIMYALRNRAYIGSEHVGGDAGSELEKEDEGLEAML